MSTPFDLPFQSHVQADLYENKAMKPKLCQVSSPHYQCRGKLDSFGACTIGNVMRIVVFDLHGDSFHLSRAFAITRIMIPAS